MMVVSSEQCCMSKNRLCWGASCDVYLGTSHVELLKRGTGLLMSVSQVDSQSGMDKGHRTVLLLCNPDCPY